MREIKFRAWNKLSKRIAIVKHVIFDGSESGIEQAFVHYDNTPLNDDKWIPKDCLELMQYTGLKDKNGKEIYEGDIVKIWSARLGTSNYKIEYHAPSFTLTVITNTRSFPMDIDWQFVQEIKVIGNIFENPELLK